MSFNVGKLNISVAGESHAKALTVIIEGIPSGEKIDTDELNKFMQRRAPGKNRYSTARRESDESEIMSGIKNGYTTGAPIAAVIRNNDTRSRDYGESLELPRPAHADYPASVKFGEYFDFCGGGQFSGRITAAVCFAGGICKQILKRKGILVNSHVLSVHGVYDEEYGKEIKDVSEKKFPVISDAAGEKMKEEIEKARLCGNSVGGIVECAISGMPVGIGDSLFGGIDGEIAKAVFGIPGVKGVEFGAGFRASEMYGTENNDEFIVENGKIITDGNNHGGVLGGMTSGMPIIVRAAFKPTPSVAAAQKTVSLKTKNPEVLNIKGRHDPCITVRASVCVEAVCAATALGSLL